MQLGDSEYGMLFRKPPSSGHLGCFTLDLRYHCFFLMRMMTIIKSRAPPTPPTIIMVMKVPPSSGGVEVVVVCVVVEVVVDVVVVVGVVVDDSGITVTKTESMTVLLPMSVTERVTIGTVELSVKGYYQLAKKFLSSAL